MALGGPDFLVVVTRRQSQASRPFHTRWEAVCRFTDQPGIPPRLAISAF